MSPHHLGVVAIYCTVAAFARRSRVDMFDSPRETTKRSNLNSNQYNPIWHKSQCCGVKWARVCV